MITIRNSFYYLRVAYRCLFLFKGVRMTSTKRGILLALSLLFSFFILKPADGDLDTSYGTAGYLLTDAGIVSLGGLVSIQSSNNGYGGVWGIDATTSARADGLVQRFTSAGIQTMPDLSNVVGTGSHGPGRMALRGNDTIVIAGYNTDGNINVLQVTTSGTLDTTFGSGTGMITVTGFGNTFDLFPDNTNFECMLGLAIQPDGKIVVAGTDASQNDIVLARVLADGSGLDETGFGTNGIATITIPGGTGATGAMSLALQPDGNIVVGGTSTGGVLLARVLADGSGLDTTGFNAPNGFIVTPTNLGLYVAVVILPNLKILAGAMIGDTDITGADFFTAQYTAQGVLDTANYGSGTGMFSIAALTQGFDWEGFGADVIVQPDGKALACNDIAGADGDGTATIVRVLADGSGLDDTWGTAGVVTVLNPLPAPANATTSEGLAIDTNGLVIGTGAYNNVSSDGLDPFYFRLLNSGTAIPAATVVTAPVAGNISTTTTFTGTAQAYSIVDVLLTQGSGPAVIVASVWTDNTGAWSIANDTPIAPGTYSLQAVARYKTANVNIASTAITVTVLSGPSAADFTINTYENTPVSDNVASHVTNTTGTVTYAYVTGSATNGTVTSFNTASGAFTFTPTTGYSGDDASFQYNATDDVGTSNTATVTVDVATVPSTITYSGCAGSDITGTLPGFGTAPYTFAVVPGSGPTNGTLISFNTSTGAFSYMPNSGTTSDSFEYMVTSSDVPPVVETITVDLVINPALTAVDQIIGGNCANVPATGTLDVTGGTPPYTVTITSPSSGTLTFGDPNGIGYTYTNSSGGSFPFTYFVTDSSTSQCMSNSATITFDVDSSPSVLPVTEPTACLGASVSDILPTPTGGTPGYYFMQVGNAVGGNVSGLPNLTGAFTFTPTNATVTSGSFQYMVFDQGGDGCPSNTAQVSFTFTSPVAGSLTLTTVSGTPVNGVLPSSGGTGTLTYNVTQPANGTVVPNPTYPNFTYTPNPNYIGPDSFTYTVTDANGCVSDPAGTVTITVAANNPPIASNLYVNACQNSTYSGTLVNSVTGGTPPLVFSLVPGTATNGIAVVNADGTFTFTTTIGSTGPGIFSYLVTDANGLTGAAVVTLTYIQITASALLATYDSLYGNLCGLVQ